MSKKFVRGTAGLARRAWTAEYTTTPPRFLVSMIIAQALWFGVPPLWHALAAWVSGVWS
jgi:hypothetical protein